MKRYLLLAIIAALLITPEVYPQHSGPFDQFTCLGDTAEFVVDHSFDYITFEWQVSDGPTPSNFSPIPVSEGYNGLNNNVLQAYTAVLSPSASGIWRYYRCRMYSNIYGWNYSDTASLEINLPPAVDFLWTNPCQGQTVHFESIVGEGAGPFKYYWTFGDTAVSVYPDPSHLYINEGIFEVMLTVTDDNGCISSIMKQVEIFSIPALNIYGKEVVCSNELGVKYYVDLEGENIHYKWDVSGFGTIDNDTQREISIGWNPVENPVQTGITLTVTIDPSGCSTQISKEVLITSYVAPDTGIIFRKPYESTLLIYKGPEVNSYHWGYTDDKGVDHYVPVDNGGERFYCDFQELKSLFDYWIETSFDSRINCVTRSYLHHPYLLKNNATLLVNDNAFIIYPVPASNRVTVRFDHVVNPAVIAIYNLMMQKVFEETDLVNARDAYSLSLEDFSSGIYIMQVTDDSGLNNFGVFTIEK